MLVSSGTQKLICALGLNKGNATDKKTADSPTDGREDSKLSIRFNLILAIS